MPTAATNRTPDERAAFRRRCLRGAAAAGLIALVGTALIGGPAQAAHPEVSLAGSEFEIDAVLPNGTGGANLKVDDASPSIDWANVDDTSQPDLASGAGDDSFGNGTKEDTEVPSVTDGSIPPNKSDLLTFGVYLEQNDTSDFLHMYWHRVQEPSGTTNMDFEFNQSTVLSANGKTPVRTNGDLLIQYDLSRGGTVPTLWLSTWIDSTGNAADCEASNSVPCWSERDNLTSAALATGSINATAIPAAESDGLISSGVISPRTFGEATVDFGAIAGEGCNPFGSAYLKSRSSDSFTSALKDFITPTPVDLDNCAEVTINKVTDPSPDPTDETFDYTSTNLDRPSGSDPTFGLKDGESVTYDDVFLGEGIVITEDLAALPAGWKLGDIDCSESENVTPVTDVETGTITFDLDDNSDSVNCTYYNETGGTVIVRKATDPTTDPADWQFGFTKAFGTLEPSEDTFTLGHGESETFENVLIGDDYTITEDDLPDGWAFEDIDCGLSEGVTPSIVDATITFSIDDADDVLDCTYGNETGGTVIIHKVTQPASDTTTSFAYSTTVSRLSGEASSPFSLKNLENQTYTDVLFDTGLTVTEDSPLPDGWELVSVNCDASVGVTPTSIVGGTVTFDIDNVEDVLECTYTNRASGSITIEKITDSGTGSFDFTSNTLTLTPDPFTLTTTAAGDAGKDSETFSDLDPGTYDVAETVPDYWNLVSATCDDGSDPASIGLTAGENITCTFHNEREVGAIEITKLRKHALDGLGENHPHAGVDFVITGGELPAEGVTVTTDANGVACVTDLLVSGLAGMYTITETVPDGYAPVGTQTANVTEAADCASANAGAMKEFVNTPLTNITVSVDSQVDDGTYSSIECDVDGSDAVSLAEEMDDPSITINDLEPRTVVCTIVIDP